MLNSHFKHYALQTRMRIALCYEGRSARSAYSIHGSMVLKVRAKVMIFKWRIYVAIPFFILYEAVQIWPHVAQKSSKAYFSPEDAHPLLYKKSQLANWNVLCLSIQSSVSQAFANN